MLVGYARTSTLDQTAGLEAQQRDLEAAGCGRLFSEHVSSVDQSDRRELAEAMRFIREGDTLVVTKLDRLARSTRHLLDIVEELDGRKASLRILNLNLDTATPTGRLMLTMVGAVAQFEREIMLERQREGIAKAKAEGKYKGRKPTAREKSDQVEQLRAEGIGPTEIAKRLGIGRASVYRILAEASQEGP
ncbi:recombinase family protein [Marinovum sp. 2_MG-2023]|uniref:recombinase family protein n=1 Tax=unclassified Marinovum TaxID=2647166 RepID=UPI0026E279F5|nr:MULTISPECIES: recombinase family protein [unclassified Marinovum]MDO6732884.1 recombinase family protein [Marinovum sp. 2_MG-2023]MDO6782167.1 recombinase family protein [Marinovum sp. 1_MG-2023]